MIIESSLTIEAVFDAYFDCRKTKRNSINQLRFEAEMETNLVSLYHDLVNGESKIGRSIAFVVTHPKVREVWAADFRDKLCIMSFIMQYVIGSTGGLFVTATPVFPVAVRMTVCGVYHPSPVPSS